MNLERTLLLVVSFTHRGESVLLEATLFVRFLRKKEEAQKGRECYAKK
jgi:hypothetical protein